jgi:hypothetical protein
MRQLAALVITTALMLAGLNVLLGSLHRLLSACWLLLGRLSSHHAHQHWTCSHSTRNKQGNRQLQVMTHNFVWYQPQTACHMSVTRRI